MIFSYTPVMVQVILEKETISLGSETQAINPTISESILLEWIFGLDSCIHRNDI